jgi:hypothetical protein
MKIIVSANDSILYYSKREADGSWTCGRCFRGTHEPRYGAGCTNCPAHVHVVFNPEVKEAK